MESTWRRYANALCRAATRARETAREARGCKAGARGESGEDMGGVRSRMKEEGEEVL